MSRQLKKARVPVETIRIPVEHQVDSARVPDAPLKPPFSARGLGEVLKRRYLLRLLVDKEIQARYQGSLLGLLWSYVQPLVRFFLYFFVIGIVLRTHQDVPNYAIHLFCGLVFINYFTETFSSGTRSIMRNKALVQKMAMPREMFPVASMIVSAVHVLPQFVILMVAALFQGFSPTVSSMFAGVLGLLILVLFGTGLALLFSALNVFFRDFENIVSTLMLFTHWAVPLMYPWSRLSSASSIPEWFKQIYLANPLAEAVILMQRAVWLPTCSDDHRCQGPHVMPDHLFTRGIIMVILGVAFLAFCQSVFSRLEGRFAERLT